MTGCVVQLFPILRRGGERHLTGVFVKCRVFDLHAQVIGRLSGFFETVTYFGGKLKENGIRFLRGRKITGECGGIADSFCLRRFAFDAGIIDSVCIFPQHFSVAFQMQAENRRIHPGQIANRMDIQFLQDSYGSMSCHEQTADRKWPHFFLNLIREKCVRLVRLFKIRSHLCQHLIGRNPHIDCKTKMAVNIVTDIGGSFFG